MYTRWLNFLNSKKIILASNSFYRQQVLKDLKINFSVLPSGFSEDLQKTNPNDYVMKTVYGKYDYFLKQYPKIDADILIFGDTIVDLDGVILEKPKDEDEMIKFLKSFSNNSVKVITSIIVTILSKDNNGNVSSKHLKQDISTTNVYFQELTDDIIQDFIFDNPDMYSASGGFDNQGRAKTLVKKIDGCFYNGDGFPVQLFVQMLVDLLEKEYGKDGWREV